MAMLTDLADVLRKAGLKVVEIPGWKTRGRPGDFAPTRVLAHHTAGAGDGYDDAYYMAVTGRADLSAPLSQLALDRAGTWYVLAAGRANHAGRCKPIDGLKTYPGETYGDGNAQMLGVEAMNRGTDAEDWTPTQYGSYVRGVAALTEHYGWRLPLGHKETSTSGKVDPDFPMDKFRRDVAETKEDDMPTLDEIAAAVWAYPVPIPNNDPRPAGATLGGANRNAWLAANGVVAPAELAAAVAACLPADTTVTQDQLEAALRNVLGSLDKETTS